MAHYAVLDENNVVTQVFVGKDEGDGGVDWEQWYSESCGKVCKRTSYNTNKGVHATGGTPFRKNYAAIGFVYREDIDGFSPPQPYPSWTLNTTTGLWDAPIPPPSDDDSYVWDEDSQSWVPA